MSSNQQNSLLFSNYKALGLVSSQVPAVVQYIPKAKLHAIICAVGNVVHTYRSRKLALWSVSPPMDREIRRVATDSKYIFVACGPIIRALFLGRQTRHTYTGHVTDIEFLLPFGDHLISVDKNSRLIVWEIESGQIFNETAFDEQFFKISALCHPVTYLNKLLLGSAQGALKLFNLRTNKLVYEFQGWNSSVSSLEQSTAVNVVAVGLEDGRILLHNIKLDETLMTFKQDWGSVSAITFRTDGPPIMISSCAEGHVALWDLEKRKLVTQMNSIHSRPITTLIALQNEPVVITSSGDNTIKMWIFDNADGSGRLLHCRDGHAKPPRCIRFHGNDGSFILSAAGDGTLKAFHTRKDHLHKNLGSAGKIRKQIAKKKSIDWERVALPPCDFLSSNTSRESGWDNVVCCHERHQLVTTWTSRRNHLGDHKLCHERFLKTPELKKAYASRCFVSSCGNFAVIGYSSGHVDVFNIQSGIYRGSFVDGSLDQGDRAHCDFISGICGDYLNSVVVTACKGGLFKFWHFRSKRLLDKIAVSSGVECMVIHADNGLIAAGLVNFSLVVLDMECKRVSRYFDQVHSDRITDLTFNYSGHWLLSASLDKTIKVWDLASASLIDVIGSSRACLSLTFSPAGEFLATVHEDSLGVYLWASKSVYGKITLKPLPRDYKPPSLIGLPATANPDDQASTPLGEGDIDDQSEESMMFDEYMSPEQLSRQLVTYSGMAAPRWASLIDLEAIKERNKPKEPPKKPKQAPFFLPTVSGLNPTFAASGDKEETENDATKQNKVLSFYQIPTKSEFARKLNEATNDSQYFEAFSILKKLNPSSIDAELRALSPVNGGSQILISKFLSMISAKLNTNLDFEVTNSYLGLFLNVHYDLFWSRNENENSENEGSSISRLPFEELRGIKEIQDSSWRKLDELFSKTLCLTNYIKSAVF